MPRPKGNSPTDRELDILQVLWKVDNASLSEVREALKPQHELAATTIATMLKVMSEKNLVRRTEDRRWEAIVSRDQAGRGLTERLVNHVFDGSAQKFVAHVVESHPLSLEEVEELQQMLDAYRNSLPKNRGRKK